MTHLYAVNIMNHSWIHIAPNAELSYLGHQVAAGTTNAFLNYVTESNFAGDLAVLDGG